MEIPVLIESVNPESFRARTGEPIPLSAVGSTSEEALANLRSLLQSRLKNGSRLTSLNISSNEAAAAEAWKRMAGTLEKDPFFNEWQDAIKEYRRQVDEDPERL